MTATVGQTMTVGSLFSGIGGFDLGLERAGMRVEWQVENNDYCRQVLKKHWPKVPCHYDITKIDWHWVPRVDLVCGGFPCQPFSVAGKQRGKEDDRYLWPEVVRCLDALRPTWFLGENVPGIINMALDQVCADLESLGYQVWSVCVPACAVDAPHVRDRIWILAHSSGERSQGRIEPDELWEKTGQEQTEIPSRRWARWNSLSASRVSRVGDGVPNRAHRTRAIGNAVVPQVVEALGRMILEAQA